MTPSLHGYGNGMKKKILMIATGGTIASKETSEGLAPALTSKELLDCVPEVGEVCEVHAVQPFNLDSTNVYSKHWLEIARIIEAGFAAYDGFVVTHGTDTMAYTAAALSYLVQGSDKPIVLTGSQRSAYSRDTDARANLSDAFLFAADDRAFGVRIVFDGNVILGTRAKKTRTRSYNAFSSIDFPAVAVMREGRPFYYIEDNKPTDAPRFYHALNENVFVLKMIPGLRADIFDYLDKHCDGLIIESFGAGGSQCLVYLGCPSGCHAFTQKSPCSSTSLLSSSSHHPFHVIGSGNKERYSASSFDVRVSSQFQNLYM